MEYYTVKQLRDMCRERGITGYSRLRKAELIEVLQMGRNGRRREFIEHMLFPVQESECDVCLETRIVYQPCTCRCLICVNCYERVQTCPFCRQRYQHHDEQVRVIREQIMLETQMLEHEHAVGRQVPGTPIDWLIELMGNIVL